MATNRIKGITVEIGGDTTDLQKALKGVNSEIKNTQSALRDVEKLLKLDPKNTELLEQKQKLLAKSVEETNEKLKTLKEAADNASEALASGEMSGDQYDALQREIIETEQNLKNLEAQAAETNKELNKGFDYEAAGNKVKSVGTKMSSVGDTMTKTVTAPILAIGAASVAAFNEVDAGLDIVTTKTGATGEALDELHASMKNVYGDMAITAEEAGTAIGEVNTRFGLIGSELEDVSSEFLKFSSINGTDLNNAIDSVDSIMKKFGVDSKNTNQVLGLMTKAGQNTGISMDTLQSVLTSNGAALKEMGLNLSSSVNLLAQMEANGVDVSTAVSGIKKSVANATKEGKSAEQALRENIDSIKSATSETEALQIATELFGSKGAPEMAQAIREGRINIDDISSSLSNYSDVVSETYEETQDATDKAAIAMNNLKIAGTELAETAFTELAPVLTDLVNGLKGVVKWFSNLDDGTKSMIIRIAGLAAVIGPVLSIVGRIMIGIGTIVTAIPKITGVITVLKGAVSGLFTLVTAHPIIAVITAIVGAVWYLWNNCEVFRESIINLWNAIKSGISAIVTGLVSFVTGAWNNLKSTVTSVIQSIKTTGISIFNNMLIGIKSISSSIGTAVINGFNSAVSFLTNLPANAYNWGKDMIDGFVSGIKDMIGTVKSAVGSVAQTVTSFLHFSRPDEGPLREYEKWMPDFMSGLAKGINDNKHLVTDALGGLTGSMSVNPIINGNVSASTGSRTINLTQPILMNGRTVANVVSEIQYSNSNVSLRSAGRR